MAKEFDTVIFCDLDGTITTEETFIGSFIRLLPVETIQYWFGKFQSGEMVLKDVTKKLFSLAKSEDYKKVEEYARTVKIRDGFSEFLDLAKEKGYPVVVISGGIRGMQEIMLAPYMDRIECLYSCDLDTSGEYCRFTGEYESDTENMAKETVIGMYKCRRSIAVGDNITDFKMVQLTDEVFARDKLKEFLEKKGKPFYAYETFHDICKVLKDM